MKFAYSDAEEPPFPFLRVVLISRRSGAQILLDGPALTTELLD